MNVSSLMFSVKSHLLSKVRQLQLIRILFKTEWNIQRTTLSLYKQLKKKNVDEFFQRFNLENETEWWVEFWKSAMTRKH